MYILHTRITKEFARAIVGYVGNATSICLYLSPLGTFNTIIRNKSTKEFKADPYLATIQSCIIWIFYALPYVLGHNIPILTINTIAIGIEAIYITIYLIYANPKQRLNVLFFLGLIMTFTALLVGLVLGLVHTKTRRVYVVGMVAVVFCLGMYGAPLTVMSTVIRTKSVKYMPFSLSFMGLFNALVWTAYGLIEFDPFVVIPNGIGAFLCVIQLTLYGCFYRTTDWNEEEDVSANQVELPTHTRPDA
ncbi:hypothetical protein H6P81_009984 [Aristolochia fimbriata]|uniref:Bidirectional sugar transporter SWEET n=1 Tax=Aristolochia fimbriata TaxID=158543 RepID=A0AAV7EN03_ARIFI|nr:hypothetical protein H6P81_009984 [Aristolochia fimbriata]